SRQESAKSRTGGGYTARRIRQEAIPWSIPSRAKVPGNSAAGDYVVYSVVTRLTGRSSGALSFFLTRAGFPAAMQKAGRGLTTTVPAPRTQPGPTSDRTTALLPTQEFRPTRT